MMSLQSMSSDFTMEVFLYSASFTDEDSEAASSWRHRGVGCGTCFVINLMFNKWWLCVNHVLSALASS